MARRSSPSRHSLATPSRRSPRQSISHQVLSPRRSPRSSTLHQFVAPRPHPHQINVVFHVYHYHPPRRSVDITRGHSGPLYYRTIPECFDPFMSDGIWSFSPRSGVTRTSTLGRKVGDIHFSLLPDTTDATFYVCVCTDRGLRWIVAERGFRHPIYPAHVLYQRGRSAPRWVLAESFARYTRLYRGNFSIFC